MFVGFIVFFNFFCLIVVPVHADIKRHQGRIIELEYLGEGPTDLTLLIVGKVRLHTATLLSLLYVQAQSLLDALSPICRKVADKTGHIFTQAGRDHRLLHKICLYANRLIQYATTLFEIPSTHCSSALHAHDSDWFLPPLPYL